MKTVTRVVLLFLALVQGIIGVWASVGPVSFYDDGPLPGLGWVKLLPPYNEHLVRDFGGMNLAMAVVFVVAAVKLTPLLVRLAAGSYFLFSVPHTIFHSVHLQHFSRQAAIVQTTGLIVLTLLLVILYAAAGRLRQAPR